MKICKHCGAENDTFATTCASCNSPLVIETYKIDTSKKDYQELVANTKISEENFCKICSKNLDVGDTVIKCDNCSNYYHKNCFDNNGGCNQPTCCSEETKLCPYCRRDIKKSALKCKHCGRFIDPIMQKQNEVLPKGAHPDAKNALIFGILALLCCPIIFGILAIIKGNNALNDIQQDPGYEGKGMAQTGKILGIVGLCLWGLGIILRAIT
ncbi:MAG: DUF4190 domain-containing protein [Bacillota bacterium]|nr:DUF4190 domain-containing protein [Bacillota bacterium]